MIEQAEDVKEGTLAATGWTQQTEKFTRFDGQADVIDSDEVAKTTGDVADLKQSHGGDRARL